MPDAPQCSASRASLLTGREPHQTGVVTNVYESALGRALPTEMPNVGSVLQRGGHATGYFGKWHLGGGDLSAYGFAHHTATNESRGVDDEAVTRSAADWMRRQRGPWLAWVSLLNPHHIYSFPARKLDYPIRPGMRPPHSGQANLAGKPAEQREFME